MCLNNGYEVIYAPTHPLARKNGFVYKHRLIYEEKLGRYLNRCEIIHHKDGNKLNNSLDNLELLTHHMHGVLHNGIKRYCSFCGKETKNKKYCSTSCSSKSQQKVVRPPKEELEKEVAYITFVDLGKKYGVTDNAVRKWCRSYGIPVHSPIPVSRSNASVAQQDSAKDF